MANQIDFIVRNGLQVTTNAVIGTYAMSNSAPVNGLIVSGEVGIGTALPTSKLHVVGNIQISNSTVISGIRFSDGTFQNTSAASYSTPPGGTVNSIQYNSGGTFGGLSNVIIHSGNSHVGIGTNKADYVLHVNSVDGPALFSTLNGSDYQIYVGDNTPAGDVGVFGYNSNGQYAYISTGNNQPTPILSVTQSGNVGIGTSTPANKFDVLGGAVFGTYAGIFKSPTNGLAVSGNVGIGTTITLGKVHIVGPASTTGLVITNNGTPGDFIQFKNSNSTNEFVINALGDVSVGGWTGNVISTIYGGTGLNSYTTGDILYASGPNTLSKLGIGGAGNALLSNGTVVYWGNVSTGAGPGGVMPISTGGTNASSFSPDAIVITDGTGLSMTEITSASNAAVVFSQSGIPTKVSGGPYTYLTPGAGADLEFAKIDLANGVSGALGAINGGTGLTAFPQYSVLYANTANNWAALGSSTTSAFVTSATGSPQWTSGAVANRVLRTNGTSVTFAQVDLTTDVTGILPPANGGLGAAITPVDGGMVYSTSSGFAVTPVNDLFFNNTNGYFGVNTNTPQSFLDVNGNVIIRNGVNVVAGGIYVQAGDSNFAQKVTVASLVSNAAISAAGNITGAALISNSTVYGQTLNAALTANVGALTSNSAIFVTGTQDSTSYLNGSIVTAGGVGIAKSLNVGNSVTIGGNLLVAGNLSIGGNVTFINSNVTVIEDPSITIGTGPTGGPLTQPDLFDRGIEFHYYANGADRYGFVGWQNATGDLIYISNATGGSSTGIYTGASGDASFGNLVIGGANNVPSISTSTTTGAIVITGTGGIGIGGGLHVGQYAYVVSGFNTGGTATVNRLISNTGISATTISASGQITGASLVSNSSITATSAQINGPLTSTGTITAQSLVSNTAVIFPSLTVTGNLVGNVIIGNLAVTSGGPISAVGTITGTGLVSNSFINGTSINSSGPLSAAGTITGANIISNALISGASIYSSGTINGAGAGIFNSLTSNTFIFGTSLNTSGSIIGNNVTSNGFVIGASISSAGPISAAGTITGSVLVANASISTPGTISSGGALTAGSIISNSTITGNVITSNSAVNTVALNVSGSGRFDSANTTTSASTGAIIATGGIATGNNLFVRGSTWAGNISVVNTTTSTSTITGALTVAGGVGIAGPLFIGGPIDAQTIDAAIGNVHPNTGQFTTLITQNTATVNALISNSFINGTSINSSGPLSAAGAITGLSLTSNSFINGTSINSSGPLSAAGAITGLSLTSNSFITASSLSVTGAISAGGNITGANLYSNAAIVGNTVQGTISILTGTFVANTSITTGLVTASNTATVNRLISNTTVGGNAFIMNGNVSSTSTTGTLVLDSFAITSYRTAHYLIQITDNTNLQYHSTQVMLIHNGTTVYQSEYNIIYSTGILGTFDSSIVAGTVQLQFTASTATNKTIKVLRTAIET